MYLSIQEVRLHQARIQAAAAALLNTKALAARPKAKQWRFFQELVRKLFEPTRPSEFDRIPAVQAAQLKFEVEDRLRRYYIRPGRPLELVFSLVHRSKMGEQSVNDSKGYPALAGYCLLVRELSGEFIVDPYNPVDQRVYLERVVAEAIDAEFRAYQSLPRVDSTPLLSWFCPESPAIKEILNLLHRHQKKGWIISNPLNPSTKRLLKVRVSRISRHEAVVITMEYLVSALVGPEQGRLRLPLPGNQSTSVCTQEGFEWMEGV